MEKARLRAEVERLKGENRKIRDHYNADVTAGRSHYLHVLHLLVPYMEGEIEHLHKENAKLREELERGRTEGDRTTDGA